MPTSVSSRGLSPKLESDRPSCKERARWRCEQCGVAHSTLRFSKTGQIYIVYLAAAHLHHDPENQEAILQALCQRCHMRYDAKQHAQVRQARKPQRKQRARTRKNMPNPAT